jgi:signal transduction histidine kinase
LDGVLSVDAVIPMLVAIALAGVAATLAIAVVPDVGFGFRAPELYTGIETSATVVSVLAAYLVAGRFRRTARLRDLALVVAFGLLAIGNFAFLTVPTLADDTSGWLAAWAAPGARLLAALALAFAALAPDVRLGDPRRGAIVAALLGTVGLGLVALGAASLALPDPPGAALAAAGTDDPQIEGPAGFLALQLVAGALFAAAAVGLAFQARNRYDRLLAWVALAAVLAALSRVHELLFPVVSDQWVLTADLLRFGMYLALLCGALAEIGAYQRGLSDAAALEERRRVARDLHDGLAQELAFISLESRRLAAASPSESTAEIATAAQRALEESRQAIAILQRRREGPFADELQEVAGRLAGRAGARLRVEFEHEVDLEPERRDPVLKIVGEAITNGVRHGSASEFVLCLSHREGLRVLVRDNGCGFDPSVSQAGGFGLSTMRERARALGGDVEVRSQAGAGTEVEVVLP